MINQQVLPFDERFNIAYTISSVAFHKSKHQQANHLLIIKLYLQTSRALQSKLKKTNDHNMLVGDSAEIIF